MADRALTPAALALAGGWRLTGEFSPLGEGHINDTRLVVTGTATRFVLQRLSRVVFADPARVMANVVRVIDHFAQLNATLVPRLIPTVTGAWAFVDDGGDWWRLWQYVAGGRSLSRTADPATCRSAGEAFGRFQRLLADLPGPALEPSIEGFLELDGYLARFDAVRTAPGALAAVTQACGGMAFVDAHRTLAARFPRQRDPIHGDCKLNNLLFAAGTPEVLAVLDLDTVMTGHWAWDLGDLSRSVLMGARTDERAPVVLAALIDGFAEGSGRRPDPATTVEATVYVAFMLGIRFLTDHLEGDRYFRVARPGDNLDRARAQFDLVRWLTAGALADHLASSAPGRR